MRSRKHAPTAAPQPPFALIRLRAPRPLHSPPCPAPRHALSALARVRLLGALAIVAHSCRRRAGLACRCSHCDRPATVAVASGTFDSARWLACFYAAANANANANASCGRVWRIVVLYAVCFRTQGDFRLGNMILHPTEPRVRLALQAALSCVRTLWCGPEADSAPGPASVA